MADLINNLFRSGKAIGLFLVLLLIVPLLAFSIVLLNEPKIHKNTHDTLSSIARLKAENIEAWLAILTCRFAGGEAVNAPLFSFSCQSQYTSPQLEEVHVSSIGGNT